MKTPLKPRQKAKSGGAAKQTPPVFETETGCPPNSMLSADQLSPPPENTVSASARPADILLTSERAARSAIRTLLALAERKGEPETPSLEHLKGLASQLLEGLYDLASMENERAAIIWAEVLKSTLMDFRRLAATKPELIKKWAQAQPEIPGLISHFRPVTKANKELTRRCLRPGEMYERFGRWDCMGGVEAPPR
jgi:hypothetical protein